MIDTIHAENPDGFRKRPVRAPEACRGHRPTPPAPAPRATIGPMAKVLLVQPPAATRNKGGSFAEPIGLEYVAAVALFARCFKPSYAPIQ